MNNTKFISLMEPGYFTIKDTDQVEASQQNNHYSHSKIVWENCSSYYLLVKDINYSSIFKVGDTLHVDVLAFKDDTLTLRATAFGKSFVMKYVQAK